MDKHLAELMTAVARVEEGIGRLDEKFDYLKGVSKRVQSLELTRARQRGGVAVVSALGAVAAYFGFGD